MTEYTRKEIISKAKGIKTSVEKEYKLGTSSTWCYYIAKAIIKETKTVKKISIKQAENSNGEHFSRQIMKDAYMDMAERLVKYVEKHSQMPNNIKVYNKKMKVRDYTYMFARILVYLDKNSKYPKYAEANSKAFTKPTETTNSVYDYFANKTGYKPKTLDGFLEYVAIHYNYEYYYDDRKSNKEVIDSKAGNCTDLLQLCVNITNKLGYEYVVLHVLCSGGDGHVRAKFRHPTYTDNEWIYRDIACVASNGTINCNWCTSGYTLLATNPSWFMQNLNR